MSEADQRKDAIGAQSPTKTEELDSEKGGHIDSGSEEGSEFDLLAYHEHNAGRLVIDPEYAAVSHFSYISTRLHMLDSWFREARIEFGDSVAKKLKLTKDGTKVLWPQPTDDPEDPQNVRV